MADEAARNRRRTAAPEPPDDQAIPAEGQEPLFGDLSDAAREAVRSPADPRLDAHLKFLGLGDPAESAPGVQGPSTGEAAMVPDLAAAPSRADIDQLRLAVARLQTESVQTGDRLRQLTFVITVLAIATVVALIIGVVRASG